MEPSEASVSGAYAPSSKLTSIAMGVGDCDNGVVAIVQGFRDAGLAVTLISRAHLLNSLRNRIHVPASKSSVETNTDCVKQNTSTQICDGSYNSSYQLAYCNFIPRLPSQELPEFPPQRDVPSRLKGNFQVTGYGSRERVFTGYPASIIRGPTLRCSRGPIISARLSHPNQTDGFVNSLRRYPLAPDRSMSAELLQRLLSYTQSKYLAQKSSRSMRFLRVKSPRQSLDKNPVQIIDNNHLQIRDKSPFQSRDNVSYQSRDQSPSRSRDHSPSQSRDKSPFQLRYRSPLQSRDRSPSQNIDTNSFISTKKRLLVPRDQSPSQSKEPRRKHNRNKSSLRIRDKSPLQSSEKKLYLKGDKSPFQSSPSRSRDRSPDQYRDESLYQYRDKSSIQSKDIKDRKKRLSRASTKSYTWINKEGLPENVKAMGSKKMLRKDSDLDARYSIDQLSETYNYLKAPSRERGSYAGHKSEIRYISDVKRCIKDTLKLMVEDKSCVCPKLKNRKSHHKKTCHSQHNVNKKPSQERKEEQGELPSTSKYEQKPVYCPNRPVCSGGVQKGKEAESQADHPSFGSLSCRFCSPLDLLKRAPCIPHPPCAPCLCPKNPSKAMDKIIEDLTREWLKEVPVCANETPNDKAKREELVKQLADKLKSIKDKEDYIEKAKEELEKCLDNLPMWYPGDERDRAKFKEQIADKLINKLKNVDNEVSVALNDIITKWLDNFHILDDEENTIQTNEIAQNFYNRLKSKFYKPSSELERHDLVKHLTELKISRDKVTSKLTDVNELKQKLWNWIDSTAYDFKNLRNNNQDLVESLAQKLNSLESDNANNDFLEREVKDFVDLLRDQGIPINKKDENELVKNLLSKTKPKQRKRWSQDYDTKKLITNEISQLINDIPIDMNLSNRQAIKDIIADILTQYIENLSGKEEVKTEIMNILKQESEILEAEASDFASALMNRVKGMPKPVPPVFRQPTITATEMRDIVQEEVNHILELVDIPVDGKDTTEKMITEVLTDQIVRGTENDKAKQQIIDILREGDVSDDAIHDICKRLMEKHREMSLSYRSLDSTLKLLKSRKNHFADLNPLDEITLKENAQRKIVDFIKNITSDDSLKSKYKRKENAKLLTEKLVSIMSDPDENNKDDRIMREVSNFIQNSSRKVDESQKKLSKQLENQLQNPDFTTSTPRKKGLMFIPKTDITDLSSIHYDNSISKPTPNLFEHKKKRYKNEVINSIKSWMDEIGLKLNKPIERDFKENMIKELAGDIEDRQKYLQLNPKIQTSKEDELEHLKYQIFRRLNKLPDANTNDLSIMMPNTEVLMDKINRIPVPQLVKSVNIRKSHSIETNEAASDKYIKDAVSDWIKTLALKTANTFNDIPNEVVDELNSKLAYLLLYRSKVPLNVIKEIEEAVSEFVEKIPLDKYKTPESKSLANSLFKKLKDYAKKDFVLSATPVKKIGADKIIDNISGQEHTPKNMINAENLKRDIISSINKILDQKNKSSKSFDDFRYEKSFQKETDSNELKDNLTEAFLNFYNANNNKKDINTLTEKINHEVNQFCDYYSKQHPELSIDPDGLRRDLFDAFGNILGLNNVHYRKKVNVHDIENKINDWLNDISLEEQNSSELLQTNKMISEFAEKLLNIEKKKELYPEIKEYDETLKNAVGNFIKKLPLTTISRGAIKKFEDKLVKDLKNMEHLNRDSSSTTYSMSISEKKTANVLFDDIADWSDNLPIKANTFEEKEYVQKFKQDLANELMKIVSRLCDNPEGRYNESFYGQYLEDEVENAIEKISNQDSNIKTQLPIIKKIIVKNIKDALKKNEVVNSVEAYKEQLRDVVSNTLPSQNLSPEFKALKDDIVDAFININYASDDEDQIYASKKKIAEEVNNFCDYYSKKHPDSPIDPQKMRRILLNELGNIPQPDDDALLRKQVKMGKIIDDVNSWITDLPLDAPTSSDQLHTNKMISEFAEKLHDIEKEQKLYPFEKDYNEALKNEVARLVKKLPLTTTKKGDIKKMEEQLVKKLQPIENSNRNSPSTEYSMSPSEKKAADELLDEIAGWSDNFPIKANTPEEKENAKKFKQDLASKMNKIVSKLNKQPEALNDESLYEQLLEEAIDNSFENMSNQDSNIRVQLPTIKKTILKNIKDARQEIQDENPVETYKDQLRDAVSNMLPLQNLSHSENAEFRDLNDNIVDAFININYATDDEDQILASKKKIAENVNTFCDNYSKRHPKSSIDPNHLRRDIYKALGDILAPKGESYGKEVELGKIKNEINNWLKDLPLGKQTSSEQIHTNKILTEFAEKMRDIEKENDIYSDEDDYDNKLKAEVTNLVKKLPLKILTKDEDLKKFTEILVNKLKKPKHPRRDSASRLYTKRRSRILSVTESVKPVEKTATDVLFDDIFNWSDKLPFNAIVEDLEDIKKIKQDIAGRIIKFVGELNINPEVFSDDFLYENMLEDGIDNILSDMSNAGSDIEILLPAYKKDLMKKITDARLKAQDENAGKVYKQRLREAISQTLPSQELSVDEEASFEVLKENLADAYINLHYVGNDENQRDKLGNKIKAQINKFCNDYLNKHPNKPVATKQLNRDLYNALKKVSEPKQQAFRNEVELVKMKNEVHDWVENLPLRNLASTEQLQINKMISVLARKLHDIEKEKELHPDIKNKDDKMRNEIAKFMKKLPLTITKDEDVNIFVNKLIDRLKNTEQTRRISASTRYSIDSDTFIKLTTDSNCCCCYSHYVPCIPPSSLCLEDQAYLQKIRERTETPKIRFTTSPHKDVSISPLPVDACSQTDIECSYSKLSCSQNLIRPCSNIPPCQRTRAVGSHADIQPKVIIKEYHWDSVESSIMSPNQTPPAHSSAYPTPISPVPCESIPEQNLSQSKGTKAQQSIQCSPSPCRFSCGVMPEQTPSPRAQLCSRPVRQFTCPEFKSRRVPDQRNISQRRQPTSPYHIPCTKPVTEKNIRRPQQGSQYSTRTKSRPRLVPTPCSPCPSFGQGYATPRSSTRQAGPCGSHLRTPRPQTPRRTWQKEHYSPLISSEDCEAGPSRSFGKPRVTRLGSLDQITPRVCKSRSDCRKLPEDSCKYWEKDNLSMPSRKDFQPYTCNQEKRNDNDMRCSCKDKFLTKCRERKHATNIRFVHDSMSKCPKCCGVHCPYPSYMFFR